MNPIAGADARAFVHDLLSEGRDLLDPSTIDLILTRHQLALIRIGEEPTDEDASKAFSNGVESLADAIREKKHDLREVEPPFGVVDAITMDDLTDAIDSLYEE